MASDRLQLLVELLKIIVWPATLVLMAVLFQAQVRGLLNRIKRGKVGSTEIEFEQSLLNLPVSGQPPPSDPYVVRLQNPARNAITESWSDLERSARDLLKRRGIPESVLPRRATGLARAMGEMELLDQDDIGLFLHLRELSIRAAVDPEAEPSAEAAARFVQAASRLKDAMELQTAKT